MSRERAGTGSAAGQTYAGIAASEAPIRAFSERDVRADATGTNVRMTPLVNVT